MGMGRGRGMGMGMGMGMPGMPGMMGFMSGKGVGSRTPNPTQTFFGTLKTFNVEKGYGHISCEAASKIFGKDVFLLQGALDGQTVEVGALLSFKVNPSPKGPQAAQVTVLPPGSFGLNGSDGSIFTGTLKSFNAEKGWGFLAGEDLQHIFGKDIFISKRDLEGQAPNVNDRVSFCVELDEGGQPVAKKASILGSYGAVSTGESAQRSNPY